MKRAGTVFRDGLSSGLPMSPPLRDNGIPISCLRIAYSAYVSSVMSAASRAHSSTSRRLARPRYDADMSLDAFQARCMSEDNSSFTQISRTRTGGRRRSTARCRTPSVGWRSRGSACCRGGRGCSSEWTTSFRGCVTSAV
ncbi:hypothetical protein BD309DRAFT_949782 [Dichomitus squalens]|uniref:Uncharacterized protein n=1 Tax=Dichomitus squalens TaxID=114155 RepID=A0A4Q9N5G5_9APHY|nr:hypothetical protein BD311DRAFT_745877 [Dichomitus squalens]TBU48299.1 hypothetical protein BD309DRAFT_949782 [Dichomitus squalens]